MAIEGRTSSKVERATAAARLQAISTAVEAHQVAVTEELVQQVRGVTTQDERRLIEARLRAVEEAVDVRGIG